ncbi:5'/3'-nucleotidase SurE [Haliea sp. E1-2-M8]|uniref:5'/3'-nucleotidase SurE n=1 Tax=Haliea sp. E1-2-M8 TaxID=3064706 RepID=UPI002727B65C|nr:5'/3'-nucleotidase SurE [Haliea sp. E1-2-M8]MDO8860158.1 5'/3'-nucleotidase SurE [Haliea sp. E1-2-M8]
MTRLLFLVLATLAAGPALALNILLTNDDGWQAPGIQSAYKALTAAGHKVTLVAPLSDQSGRGGAMNTDVGSYVAVNRVADNMWSVAGTPSDSVRAGLQVILRDNPPDIVISGSNFGQNLARAAAHQSGTVNAALQAAFLGYPAIAISVGLRFDEFDAKPQRFPSTIATFGPAGKLLTAMLEQLQQASPERLLPAGLALNVNVPAGWQPERGLRLAPLSTASHVDMHWRVGERPFDEDGGELLIDAVVGGHGHAGDDAHLFEQGYVTVTPIDGSADTWVPVPGLAGALEYRPDN